MSNFALDVDKYYCESRDFIEYIITRFNVEDLIQLFGKFGLLTRERNGYVYPYSEQAAAVREVLLHQCLLNGVIMKTGCETKGISEENGKFVISLENEQVTADYLVLATGGKSFAKSGSDGSGYAFARQFGHHVTRTVPALTALICHEKWFSQVAGVRVKGTITLFTQGNEIAKDAGEIQLTDYGISGIPVFNISRQAAYLLKARKNPYVILDFMPDFSKEELQKLLAENLSRYPERHIGEQLSFYDEQKTQRRCC